MDSVKDFLDAVFKPNDAVLAAEVALGVIALGTLVLGILKVANPRRDLSFARRRFTAWWIMGIVFCLAVSVDRVISLVFIAAVSFLATREYLTVIGTRPADRRAILWAYLTIPFQYFWIHQGRYEIFIIFIPVFMLLSIPFRLAFRGSPAGVVDSIGRIHWGMMLFIFGISHLAYLVYHQPAGWHGPPGSLLLFVVIVTEVCDVIQFLLARLSKRFPFAPELGTRKTWPGLVGAIIAGGWLGVALEFLIPMRPLDAGLIGAGIALTGFAGSLVVTAIRRDVNASVRDTAIIDHIDSHCYTAPLFFHLIYLVL